MKNNRLAIIEFSFFLSLIILTGCKEDKLSGRSINALRVLHTGFSDYTPLVKIDGSNNRIYVNVGQEHNLTSLVYSVTLSPGATLKEKPNDVSSPVALVVQAEDGSTQAYTLIVTRVTGGFATQRSSSLTSVRQMRAIFRCTSVFESQENVVTTTPGVSIEMKHCGLTGLNNEDYIRLFLRNKKLSQDLKGTYSMGTLTAGGSSTFGYRETINANVIKFSPTDGQIIITRHDRVNNVLSGEFSNVTYTDALGGTYPRQIITGRFDNVPIR